MLAFIKTATALVLAAAVLGPAVSGATGLEAFTASRMQVEGDIESDGSSALVDLRGPAGDVLSGKFGSTYGYAYERAAFQAYAVGQYLASFDDVRRCDTSDPWADCVQVEDIADPGVPLKNAAVHITSTQDYTIHVYAMGDSFSMSSAGQRFLAEHAPGAKMTGANNGGGAVKTTESAPLDDQDEPSRELGRFATRVIDEPIIICTLGGSAHKVTLHGDFIIEIIGASVRLDGDQYDATVISNSVVDDGPYQEEIRFVRLFVEKGRLDLSPSALTNITWATPSSAAKGHDASFVFEDVVARAEANGQPSEVVQSRMVLEGDLAVALAAEEDAFNVGVAPQESPAMTPHGAIAVAVGETWFWTIVGLAAVGAILLAVFRTASVPPLPKVEAALQSGSYRKAARLSTRILRANPRQESAHLSRAIAWSRAGQNDRIVRHVEPFLRRHEPSDGTIHYVLGLAYLDLGREGDARTMMEEAVARTPSLLAEVSPSLRTTRHEGDAYT